MSERIDYRTERKTDCQQRAAIIRRSPDWFFGTEQFLSGQGVRRAGAERRG
jgi:hypothetical protein